MDSSRRTDPLTRLVAEAAHFAATDRVLLLNADDPGLLGLLAERVATIDVYVERASTFDRLTTLSAGRRTSSAVINLHAEPFPLPIDIAEQHYDTAIAILPKGREYGRALLWSARQALRPGGLLYMVGANDSGIKTLISDAERLFKGARSLTNRDRARIGVAVQPPRAGASYPDAWGDLPTLLQRRLIARLDLWTAPGIFSWQALDAGTALLIDALGESAERPANVLDVGCGVGVIGLALLARQLADRVTLTDDQLLAVRCARLNAEPFGGRATVAAGDLFAGLSATARGTFDRIVSNPPFHQGFMTDDQVARRLIAEAGGWLIAGGRLTIVGNGFLPYERLLKESFGAVVRLRETPQFTVWEAV